MTLYETIVRNAKEKPDRPAYTYFACTRTHGEMLTEVDRTADALALLELGEGDRIGLALPNSPALLNLFYAINKLGAVAVLMNPKSPSEELARQLKMTECKALFFSTISYRAVAGVGRLAPELSKLYYIAVPILEHMPLTIRFALMGRQFGKPGMGAVYKAYPETAMTYSEFLKEGRNGIGRAAVPDDSAEAVIIFSGGTGGTFKAVVHSSAGLYESAVNCLKTEEPLPPDISMLAILPAFHIFGLSVAIHLPMVADGCTILVPVFNLGIVTRIIRRECPTFFPGVPTIFERLLSYPKFARLAAKGKLNFAGFRHGFVGGDHLSDEVRDAFNAVIRENGGDGYISMGYGMSECCPVCVNDRTSGEPECIGIPFETTMVRILKECERDPDHPNAYDPEDILPEGEIGEIAIASSYMMLYGYDEEGRRNEPCPVSDGEGTAKRWLRTGDLGCVRDGKLFYRCRERRIIKVSGNTIFADSIERVIEENVPTVVKAYVVPVPHASRGHVAYAFAETAGEMPDDALLEVVQRTCKDKMISYAIPAGLTQITPQEVPRTAIGKIAWGKLENRAKELI